MIFENQYPISTYEEVTPLCEKGHVMLVQQKQDGNLYVKKYLQCYNPEIYVQLKNQPVKDTPMIHGIYKGQEVSENGATNLITIEEYFPGSTIAEHLQEKGLFSEKETIRIAIQLCRILIDLHRQKPAIIHRDIKPSNVMILPEGDVKLIDFNAAKVQNRMQSQDTVLIGTAGFAAPEQYGFSASSPRTDIYAVGVLMNIMLCGKMPSEELADGKLKGIIHCCLEVNPKDRYCDVKELYHALKYLSKVKIEWLPPGFRTLNIFKMIIAVLGYFTFFVFLTSVDMEDYDTKLKWHMFRCALSVMWILIVVFYSNYLNLRRKFPLMRAGKPWVRSIGYILAPFFIFWAVIMVVAILELVLL